jgi:hypothetical protein
MDFPAIAPVVETSTGWLVEFLVDPLPSCPENDCPQQNAFPEAVTHVCELLEDIESMLLPDKSAFVTTGVGTNELLKELLPSWPETA